MSVIINSRGQSKTPQVKLNESPDCPNKVNEDGANPNTFSNENIFPPIHSAINALATKKAVKKINKRVGLSFKILCIISIINIIAQSGRYRSEWVLSINVSALLVVYELNLPESRCTV